jgi:hypothetical protein
MVDPLDFLLRLGITMNKIIPFIILLSLDVHASIWGDPPPKDANCELISSFSASSDIAVESAMDQVAVFHGEVDADYAHNYAELALLKGSTMLVDLNTINLVERHQDVRLYLVKSRLYKCANTELLP